MPLKTYLMLRSAQRACPRLELGGVSKHALPHYSRIGQFVDSLVPPGMRGGTSSCIN